MGLAQTAILGAVAGFTIYLGLPIGRLVGLSEKLRAYLSMTSAGILLFLFFDIFHEIEAPIQAGLAGGAIPGFAPLMAVFLVGFGLGLGGLIAFERRYLRRHRTTSPALAPSRLAVLIAAGIGLHNFTEGLAIGQSAGAGELALAAILIAGFGLHNATEGFGIVGPMMGKERPSWGFLGMVGLIGGGPTFIGTMVGYYFVSQAISVLFLAMAAGALVYIFGELFQANWRSAIKTSAGWGIFTGFVFAFLADLLLMSAGV
jgi:ZIP family zinc transporter